jgi:mRNA interferase MazF
VVISQGEIWWADLAEPVGSEPGYPRPVVVIQGDTANRSRLGTAICIALTGNLNWADAPGNVFLPARLTGLPRDSVANVSQVLTVDKTVLRDCIGKLSRNKIELILSGLDSVLRR